MAETILTPDQVDVDGKYIRIGSDVTFIDETDTRVIADPTPIDADPEDPCDKKTVRTKSKFGMGGTEITWPVGVFRRPSEEVPDGRQDLYAPMEICLSNTQGEDKEWTKVQDVIENIPLNDELGITNCFGELGDIYLKPNNSAGDTLHVLKHKIYETYGEQYEYVGVRWKANSVDAINALRPDTKAGLYGTYFDYKYDELQYVEWCYMEELEKGDFHHNAATEIGGALSEDLTLTAGTYDNTGTTLGAYNITIDTSGGEIWVRTREGGTQAFDMTGAGSLQSTDSTNKVYFTSRQDWQSGGSGHLGGEDTGKTGAASAGDWRFLCDITNNGDCTLENAEVWYGGNIFYILSTGAETGTLSLTDVLIEYGGTSYGISNVSVNTATLNNVKFASTCTFGGAVLTSSNDSAVTNFTDCTFAATQASSDPMLRFNKGSGTATRCLFNGALGTGEFVDMLATTTASSVDFTANNCVFDGTNITGAAKFITIAAGASETINVTASNCQFTNNDGGTGILDSALGGTVNTTLDYNNWYNNSTDVSGGSVAKGANATAVDPAYTTVAPGTTISSNMPDGWVSGTQNNGSDTYDNLSIDEGVYTGDGTQQAGTANVTIGMLYEVSAFGAFAPTVSNVSGTSDNGTYTFGQTIAITVQFSEAVVVDTSGGNLTLELETGAVDSNAFYSTGSGTDTLTFNFQVGDGDTSADLEYVDTSSLTVPVDSSIKDAATEAVDAVATLPTIGGGNSLSDNKAYVVDGVKPAITNVTSAKSNGTYGETEVIDITVTYDKNVDVDTNDETTIPYLELETGDTDAQAPYTSGTGTDTLTFRYTISDGDASADLDYKATGSLNWNGGSVKLAGFSQNAQNVLPTPGGAGSLGDNKAFVIDTTTAGTVSAVSSTADNGTYVKGDSIPITVTFSAAVKVTGSPRLVLDVKAGGRNIFYQSGTGTNTLTFGYIVGSQEETDDLDYVGTGSLTLNGGSILMNASPTNTPTLTLASPGSAGSISNAKDIVITPPVPAVGGTTSPAMITGML